nr:MAG TPA: hypothetical protein [Caudoviricetes sp.]
MKFSIQFKSTLLMTDADRFMNLTDGIDEELPFD